MQNEDRHIAILLYIHILYARYQANPKEKNDARSRIFSSIKASGKSPPCNVFTHAGGMSKMQSAEGCRRCACASCTLQVVDKATSPASHEHEHADTADSGVGTILFFLLPAVLCSTQKTRKSAGGRFLHAVHNPTRLIGIARGNTPPHERGLSAACLN